jgi:hypothetical protein
MIEKTREGKCRYEVRLFERRGKEEKAKDTLIDIENKINKRYSCNLAPALLDIEHFYITLILHSG